MQIDNTNDDRTTKPRRCWRICDLPCDVKCATVTRGCHESQDSREVASTPFAPRPVLGIPGEGTKASLRYVLEVGGFVGQSVAFFSESICFRVNLRDPRLIPWQRTPAASHASLLAN